MPVQSVDHPTAPEAEQARQLYLLHALADALDLRELHQLRHWAQGPLQAVLPHAVLACIRLGSDGEPLRIECLHGGMATPALTDALCDPARGLAMAAQRLWRRRDDVPLLLHQGSIDHHYEAAQLLRRLAALGLHDALAHGTPTLPGGSTFFLLCGLPHRPGQREAGDLRVLLPALHLALQRICVAGAQRGPVMRALSPREAEVLHWLREGKSNDEIGQILGISGLTVKNHLQRLYKLLGVSNRAHAVARSDALALSATAIQSISKSGRN
jgi:transcriptional regulator EpsA